MYFLVLPGRNLLHNPGLSLSCCGKIYYVSNNMLLNDVSMNLFGIFLGGLHVIPVKSQSMPANVNPALTDKTSWST